MARPERVRGSSRPVAFALSALLVTGCWAGEQEQSAPSELPGPTPGSQPEVVDTLGPGPRPGGLQTDSSEGDLGDSLVLAIEQATPGDTAPYSITEISDRVRRLEEENDSLRITLRTLIPLLSARNGADSTPGSQTASQEEILSVGREEVQNWGLRSMFALLILALTGLLVRVVVWVLEKLAERNAKRRLIFKRLVPILRIFLWAFAAFFVIRVVFSVQGQEFLAAGAAVGVAVGFAAQDILKNIFGGLIVLFDQPFQVGDKISVGGTYGEVVSIGLRSTRITTPDDSLVTVPNSQVVDGQVANANAGELNCQVVTDLYLPGWVDEGEAKRIAFDAAVSSKFVYLNKPIVVLVKDKFEDTFLTHLKVKAYVLDPRYEFLFMSDVTERARAGFRKAGLLGPMHGVRAYVDLDRFPEVQESRAGKKEEEE